MTQVKRKKSTKVKKPKPPDPPKWTECKKVHRCLRCGAGSEWIE